MSIPCTFNLLVSSYETYCFKGTVQYPSRWIWLKVVSFERPSLKVRGAEIFSFFCSTPILWEHFIDFAPLPPIVGNLEPNCLLRTQLYLHPSLHHWQWRLEIIWKIFPIQWHSEKFEPECCFFLFAKKPLASLTSTNTPPFSIPRAQWIFSAPLVIRLLIANNCTRWRCNFKGLSHDGEQADLF